MFSQKMFDAKQILKIGNFHYIYTIYNDFKPLDD